MTESNPMTDKPVQRYEEDAAYASVHFHARDRGGWCRSSDVSALEAEKKQADDSFSVLTKTHDELCDSLNMVLDQYGLGFGEDDTYAGLFRTEIARLRRIVEAGDALTKYIEAKHERDCLDCTCLFSVQNSDEWKAYDAAKSGAGEGVGNGG